MSSMGPDNRFDCVDTPALLTRTFTSAAISAARRTDSGSVMSSATGTTPGMSIVSGRRAAAYTVAPRVTSSVAKRLPKPRFAPVTSATILSSRRLIVVMSTPPLRYQAVLYQPVNNGGATLFPAAVQERPECLRIGDGDGERRVVAEPDDPLDLLPEVNAQTARRIRAESQTVVGQRESGTDRRPPSIGTGDVGLGDVSHRRVDAQQTKGGDEAAVVGDGDA